MNCTLQQRGNTLYPSFLWLLGYMHIYLGNLILKNLYMHRFYHFPMSWFITLKIQNTDWKQWLSQSLPALPRILQELRLQKIPLQKKKKRSCCNWLSKSYRQKFIKTQGNVISELEEPLFYCRNQGNFETILRLSKRGSKWSQKSQHKSLRKDATGYGTHIGDSPTSVSIIWNSKSFFSEPTTWASEIEVQFGFLLKEWSGDWWEEMGKSGKKNKSIQQVNERW